MQYPQYPKLPDGMYRPIFVMGLPPQDARVLEARGYTVTEVNTLPRSSDQDNIEYLLAKAQGIEEGTIGASAEDRKILELEMRAYGLLDKRSMALKINLDAKTKDIDQLFSWGQSRHTLASNSTVVSAQRQGKDTDG